MSARNPIFQDSKPIFIVSNFKVFPKILLKQMKIGVLPVWRLFYVFAKENLHFSLTCSLYCCLVKGLSSGVCLAIWRLVAYKPVTYKKTNKNTYKISYKNTNNTGTNSYLFNRNVFLENFKIFREKYASPSTS